MINKIINFFKGKKMELPKIGDMIIIRKAEWTMDCSFMNVPVKVIKVFKHNNGKIEELGTDTAQ